MDFYHLLNRGVDKRIVFNDKQDYIRFLRNLALLNTTESYSHNDWMIANRLKQEITSPLVNIHAYSLMPNHYHLLVSPIAENGISLFMKKINMSYSKYFNERNSRTGALWQGKYKSVMIEEDSHFTYIPYYIHLNPLDLIYPDWRKGKVSDTQKALKFLNEYQWSSHKDFSDSVLIKKSLVSKSIFIDRFKQQSKYTHEIKKIISTDPLQISDYDTFE